jgi:hypothetical protein
VLEAAKDSSWAFSATGALNPSCDARLAKSAHVRLIHVLRSCPGHQPYKPSKIPGSDDIGLEELMVDENDLPF